MILGIGTDLIEIKRIKNIFNKWEFKFARKILNYRELQFFSNFTGHCSSSQCISYLAKRFAAKEAIGKALGLGIRYPVNFKSIEISNDFYGKPYPVFNDELKKFCDNNKYKLHLSISDQKKYAQAFAIIEILEN